MSLRSVELLGVQTPQILVRPADVVSLDASREAIDLADSYGICRGYPLDGSQRLTLEIGLGERADGSWAAATMADFEPRQNGKNDSAAARELAGLILFDEKLIIHTAHEAKTAKQSFERMVAVFEAWDDLRAKVRNIRYANGEQGVYMLNGAQLLYATRTAGAGRGFAEADLVVYDEAQHLQAEHLAASAPTMLANTNSQAWYMGSGGMSHSHAAWRMRKRALKGVPGRYGYVEHTAEDVSFVNGKLVSVRPDVFDREAWAMANAAYGYRITDEKLFDLLEQLGPEMFGRECLNLWDAEAGEEDRVFSAETWQAVQDPSAQPAGRIFVAVDQSWDRQHAAIAVAGGGVVALVEPRPTADSLAAKVIAAAQGFQAPVAFDPTGPASWLKPHLEGAGVELIEVAGQKMGQACGVLFAAVSDGQIRVRHHVDLDAAVAGARKQDRSDAWVWSRKDGTDISPLVAVTLAWWAAAQAVPSDAFDGSFVDLDDF